ncbi:MAG: ATP-binding protein, partial [Duganella sp.]
NRSFRHVAEAKNLPFGIEAAQDLPRTIDTDSKRLQQILKNLLSNAVKFTAHGHVDVRVKLASSGWSPDHPVLRQSQHVVAFAVEDTGIGVAPEKQRLIFEAFQQADAGTSRKYGGTGLGLTISRKLVALMGGAITVASEAGAGSAFTVTIPAALPAEPPADGGAAEPQAPAGLGTLLFMDGHLPSLKALLHHAAYLALPAASANTLDEGLALLRAHADIGVVCISADLYQAAPQRVQDAVRQAAGRRAVRLVLMHAVPGPSFDDATFAAAITRPVTRRSLLRALVQLAAPAGDVPAEQGQAAQPLAGRRLLLVEDNPINQLVASRLLELAGATPAVAENGRDALELLAMSQAPFDIILMDVQMPVMDGYEATRILRERGVVTPILAMSAGVTQAERGECLAAGMNDFISKPVDADEMVATIVRWLST